jgi:hypothetical protein
MADDEALDFDAVRIYHEVSPGGFMIIPPQDVAIRITGLAEGGCRIEAIPDIRTGTAKGPVRLGVRKPAGTTPPGTAAHG